MNTDKEWICLLWNEAGNGGDEWCKHFSFEYTVLLVHLLGNKFAVKICRWLYLDTFGVLRGGILNILSHKNCLVNNYFLFNSKIYCNLL